MSSRRPQGEGSVYRLPDGRWRGVVDLGWHDGKRRRKYITRSTQAEVVRELRRLTSLLRPGLGAVLQPLWCAFEARESRSPLDRSRLAGRWIPEDRASVLARRWHDGPSGPPEGKPAP
jgi:hypothetical protein